MNYCFIKEDTITNCLVYVCLFVEIDLSSSKLWREEVNFHNVFGVWNICLKLNSMINFNYFWFLIIYALIWFLITIFYLHLNRFQRLIITSKFSEEDHKLIFCNYPAFSFGKPVEIIKHFYLYKLEKTF